MTDRDRLIALMIEAEKADTEDAPFSEFLADFLLANGVTVNEWRPASEPPTEDDRYLIFETTFDGKFSWQKVCRFATNLEKVDKFDFKGKKRAGWYDYSGEYGHYEIDDVTHWMPLPTPPKGVDNG